METKEENFVLKLREVNTLNSFFPDDEPVFVIDEEHRTFQWAKNREDSMMRIEAKIEEMRKVK